MGLKQNLQDIQTNLANAKTAIAQSITNKGVECSADEALSTYSTKIDNIISGGKFNATDGLNFQDCTFTEFDGLNIDTSNMTDMSNMFYGCSGLTSLDLSNWNTSNVTNMSEMFTYCRELISINVSSFDTSNVTDMSNMFYACNKLTYIDVSNFDISNVVNFDQMFIFNNSLNHIKCKQAFKNWCLDNQKTIALPAAMKDGGNGKWEIVD